MKRDEGIVAGGGWKNRGMLDERLRGVIARARWASRGERTGAAVWPVAVAIVAAVVIDATLALPGLVRAGIGVGVLMLVARVVVGLVPSREARRMNAERAARLAEERGGVSHNALINAVQLRPLASARGGVEAAVSGELARRAVALGDARAGALRLRGLIDSGPIKRAWGWSLVAVLGLGVAWLASPRMFAMGVPRFVEPFADHPPFTLTDFEVSWEPTRVLAGDTVTIVAGLGGRLPASLEIVMVDAGRGVIDRAPMTALAGGNDGAADGRARGYTAVVRDLRETLRFYVEGDTGRSRVFVIEPEMRPRIESVELRVLPPAYTGLPETVHASRSLGAGGDAIAVLVGSTVTLRALTTVDLERVEQDGSTVSAGAGVSGREAVQQLRFDAVGERTMTLRPVAVGGLACETMASASVDVVADAPPEVRIEEPALEGEVFVLEGAAFPVAGVATDDVALTRLALAYWHGHGGDGSLPIEHDFLVETAGGRGRSADGRMVVSTVELGAVAGDTITLVLSATDNRGEAFGGAQRSESNTITVRVMDREAFARRFAEALRVEQITRPYEALARDAEELDRRAQDLRGEARELKRDLERMPDGGAVPEPIERGARALQERVDAFNAMRESLLDEVERRLSAPDAVDFDAQMREPLERLRDRLEAMETPDVPRLDAPTSGGESGEPEASEPGEDGDAREAGADGGDQGEQSEQEAPKLDRARVGQWLEKAARAAEQSAEQAGLAADEAALDMARPAAALELADRLQRTLERVDDAARRQRMLADRLATMTSADGEAREELAASQESIQAEIERAIRDLRTLGDRAEHELGSDESPSRLARSILDERAGVQEAIDDIAAATSRMGEGLGAQSVRALIDESAGLVMDEVYRRTLPVTDSLSAISGMPARDDSPGAEALTPAVEEIRRALEVLEQIEAYLDEAREAIEETGGGTVAVRSVRAALAVIAVGYGPGLSADADEEVVRAIEAARFRIARLRATLRQVELGMTPLLPKMGASAQSLAEGVVGTDAPGSMEAAAWALRGGDLAAAAERAAEAADALEALYEDPGQSRPGESGAPDMDQEMQLRRPSDEQSSQSEGGSSSSSSGSRASEGGSTGGGARPSTLEQLAQNRQRGSEAGEGQAPGEQSGGQSGGQPSDDARGGSSPGDREGAAGGAMSPGAMSDREEVEGARERSRFFNEMLYEERELPPDAIDGSMVDGGAGRAADRAPGDRGRGSAGSVRAVPRGLTGAGAAAFVHVPEAYKDVVAAYFERIAREAEGNGETP